MSGMLQLPAIGDPNGFYSHQRSWRFYAESVKNPKAFKSVKCNSLDQFKARQFNASDTSFMGFGLDLRQALFNNIELMLIFITLAARLETFTAKRTAFHLSAEKLLEFINLLNLYQKQFLNKINFNQKFSMFSIRLGF